MRSFNIERLREAVAWAEREAAKPKGKWDQTSWARGKVGRNRKFTAIDGLMYDNDSATVLVEVKCKTAYCVAGHLCADQKDAFVTYDWAADYDGKVSADYVIPKGTTEAISIETRAADLLGITAREAEALFEGANDLDDVRRIARRIAKKRGYEL